MALPSVDDILGSDPQGQPVPSVDDILGPERNAYLRTMDALAGASGKVADVIKAGAESAVQGARQGFWQLPVSVNRTVGLGDFPGTQAAEAKAEEARQEFGQSIEGAPFWERVGKSAAFGAGQMAATLPADIAMGAGVKALPMVGKAAEALPSFALGMGVRKAGDEGPLGFPEGVAEGLVMHGVGGLGQSLSVVPRVATQAAGQGALAAGMTAADTLAKTGQLPTVDQVLEAGATGAAMGLPFGLAPGKMGVERPDSGVRIDTRAEDRLNVTAFPGSSEGNRLSPEQFGAFLTDTPAGQALSATIADLRAAGQDALADKLQVTSANAGGHVEGSRHYKGQAVDINSKALTPDEHATLAQFAAKQGLMNDVTGEPWHFSYRGQPGGDADYLARVRQAESGGDDNARAATSSASGPYQFTDGTWRAMVQQYGKDHGLTLDGKNDPAQQATAAALLTRDNRDALRASLGREPSDGDLYLAHVFGRTGAERILDGMAENPDAEAIGYASPATVRANRSIFFAKNHTRTLQEVYDLLAAKVAPREGETPRTETGARGALPTVDAVLDGQQPTDAWPLRPELAALRGDMEARAPGVVEGQGSPWDMRPPAARIDEAFGADTPLGRQAELASLRQDILSRDVAARAADEMGAPVPATEAARIGARPALPEGQGFDMVPDAMRQDRLPARLEDSPTMPAQPGDVRFHLNDRPAEAFRGIAPEDVAHGIKGYTEAAPGAAPVQIVRTQAELPPHILEEYRRSGETGAIEGVYDRSTRRVWLVSDNLESKTRAGEIWLHENVAHHGLRAVFGTDKNFDKFLMRNAKEFDYGSDHIAMEEHIARLAERMNVGEALKPQERSLWGRFVDYVRGWLVKHGWATPKQADLEALLRDSLVRMSREKPGQGAETGARFSVAGQGQDYQRDRIAFDGQPREPLGERAKDLGREAYRRLVHKDQPLVDLARRADSVAAQDIENQIRRMRGLGGIAEEMLAGKGALRYGVDGQETVYVPGTKSLKDILSPLKTQEQYRDYESLRAAERERALAIHRPELVGNDRARAEFEISRLERKYGPDGMAMLRGVSAAHRQFERDAILTPLHEAGWISKAAYDAILKAPESEYYASFAREMEDVESQAVGSRDVVRKIKGSERKVLPSTEATIANVARAVKLVETLKLHQQIVSLRDLTPDLAQEIKLYKKGGLAPRDALVTVQNGQKTYWKVPSDVAKALDAFNAREVNVIVKALSYPAKWLRVGATLGLEFIARNPLRDQISAFVFSKAGGDSLFGYNPFTDFARGIFHTIKGEVGSGSDWYSEWRAAGGAESFMTSLDRDAVRLTTKDLVGYRTGKDAWGRYLKNPLEALRAISEFGEKGTRVGAFIKAREKGATPLEAMGESRDITLDFSRMGADTKVLNQLVAFWNANVQGVDKMARALKERPGITLLRAGLGLTLPSVTLAMLNQGEQWYEELPSWQKDYFWCFKVGDTILRLPKPFELGILFGSLPERIVDFAHKRDPQGFKDVARAAADALTPGWMPTAALPVVESIANYSFFSGKPLENQAVQSLPPGMRATAGTSELFKRAGQLTDISPIKMENWFRAWTGSMGKLALDASGLALRDPNVPPVARTAADIPLVRGFVAREPIGSGSESVDRFYDNLGEATQAQQGRKALLEAGNKAGADQYDRNAFFAPAARALSAKMSDMRAEIAGIQQATDITSEDKRQRIDAINRQMTTAAREFDEAYRTGKITPEILYLGERSRVHEALDQYKELVQAGRVDEARALVKSAGLDTKAGLVKWADAAMAQAGKIRKAAEDNPRLSGAQRAAYLAQADRITQTALAEFKKRMGGAR